MKEQKVIKSQFSAYQKRERKLDPLLEVPLRHFLLFATVGLNLSEDFMDLVDEDNQSIDDGSNLPWLELYYLHYIKKKAPPPPPPPPLPPPSPPPPDPPPSAAERYFCL